MNLFSPIVPVEKQHPIFRMLTLPTNEPERAVLTAWAEGFPDRDGKFVKEFQTTFESCLWEIYLHACLKELGHPIDFSFRAPDFVVTSPDKFSVEATIAAPAKGGRSSFNWTAKDIPDEFIDFNIGATLRFCNAFDSKIKKYRKSYSKNSTIAANPYVIAIGAYDRPLAHLAAGRPVLAALYGFYQDEDATPPGATDLFSYEVSAAPKGDSSVPVGLFCDERYSDVSAVFYSSLATMGKLRALAVRPGATMVFNTLHPNLNSLIPIQRTAKKDDYVEHLLDGAWLLHNPFAKHPLSPGSLSHARISERTYTAHGEALDLCPDDFLLTRHVVNLVYKPDAERTLELFRQNSTAPEK